MAEITKEQVEHIAKLARMKLTEEEKTKLTKELGGILTYISKLNEVNTESIEPTAQVTGLESVYRKDEVGEPLANPADLVAQVPQHERGFVKVKGVFHNEE